MDGYKEEVSDIYDRFKKDFGLNDKDAVLILKDMLYLKYKESNNK